MTGLPGRESRNPGWTIPRRATRDRAADPAWRRAPASSTAGGSSLVAFICHAVNVGLIFYAWSVFLTPLAAEFGGRGRVAVGYSAMQLAAARYGLVGRPPRRPPRRAAGADRRCRVARARLLPARRAVTSLPALYVCLAGPVALGSTCIGALPNNAAVARWFVAPARPRARHLDRRHLGGRHRVRAARAVPDRARRLAAAYAILALASSLVLVLPPVLAFMRRDPADMGLLPDGEPPPARGRAPGGCSRRRARAGALGAARRRRAPAELLAARRRLRAHDGGAVGRAALPDPAPARSRHARRRRRRSVLGATAAMGVVGKLGFGALLDRFDQRRVAAVCFCLQAARRPAALADARARCCSPATSSSTATRWAATRRCRRASSARRSGACTTAPSPARLTPFVVLAQAIGVPATGYLRDVTGSYGPALAIIVAASLVAAVVVLRVRLPERSWRR